MPAPLARFFSSGTLQLRYGTSSNVDASDIDQLVISGRVGSTGAGGTTGAGGSTGAGGMTGAGGAGGSTGAGGTTGAAGRGGAPGGAGGSGGTPGSGVAFSLPCNTLSVAAGQMEPVRRRGR